MAPCARAAPRTVRCATLSARPANRQRGVTLHFHDVSLHLNVAALPCRRSSCQGSCRCFAPRSAGVPPANTAAFVTTTVRGATLVYASDPYGVLSRPCAKRLCWILATSPQGGPKSSSTWSTRHESDAPPPATWPSPVFPRLCRLTTPPDCASPDIPACARRGVDVIPAISVLTGRYIFTLRVQHTQ